MDKKALAAIAGVMALVNTEDSGPAYVPRLPAEYPHPYSQQARQQIMQYRDITQRRIIKRSR
ncbi:MAG: hypothetical protein CVU49_06670 [Candidatus Cloacimonetes bacterium HGW-Cloacimonetes-2]|jgi:hypothetical protein|nr:MAG: hypothetical protein CVU49_06670 [Candidatus Cloacimonetes bacterium HGW-Cloacimonetes-2]